MGKGFSSFLDFFKIEDDEDYDDYEEEQDYEDEKKWSKGGKKAKVLVEDSDEDELPKRTFRSNKSKVVPMSQSSQMMEVKVIKPINFEDSQEICNTLLRHRPVIVNLEGFDSNDAQRIMDFIAGCIYAINGKFHPISKYIFIFSPENVDISGDSLSVMGEGLSNIPTINHDF